MHTHHDTQQHPGHEHASGSDLAMAEMLELDAAILDSYLAGLLGEIAGLADRAPVQILDLGSGPGAGTLALLRQFPGAAVTAADISPQMLHRLEKRASAGGTADRVRTLPADLDEDWPLPEHGEAYDLIWTASFLHHLADPDRGLAQAFGALRPGGLLAVSEMHFFPRVLPEGGDIGGLEARVHAVTNTEPPHEWSEHLERAGFILESRHAVEIRRNNEQAGPALNRYAEIVLGKLRSHAQDSLTAEDLTALDTLLDPTQPTSLARRRDLRLRTTRTAWIARRP